jgi:hypothetical protein
MERWSFVSSAQRRLASDIRVVREFRHDDMGITWLTKA